MFYTERKKPALWLSITTLSESCRRPVSSFVCVSPLCLTLLKLRIENLSLFNLKFSFVFIAVTSSPKSIEFDVFVRYVFSDMKQKTCSCCQIRILHQTSFQILIRIVLHIEHKNTLNKVDISIMQSLNE